MIRVNQLGWIQRAAVERLVMAVHPEFPGWFEDARVSTKRGSTLCVCREDLRLAVECVVEACDTLDDELTRIHHTPERMYESRTLARVCGRLSAPLIGCPVDNWMHLRASIGPCGSTLAQLARTLPRPRAMTHDMLVSIAQRGGAKFDDKTQLWHRAPNFRWR